ncbi:SURF4 family-domain-containing protein [Fimicolochytrium jonesii]|uniref:SURF4 family-domain-containing protein n=1 Tax=Fimicolochytrium jonesii TaxID=1396493 RepID=UPI0022FE87A6|nr:SURF4 family-domain-containing protein [Fimicolochytrium jonesii]KAI8817392.1 SURF4 family-domain-containing protein [Fimicolochytrium jonesii]
MDVVKQYTDQFEKTLDQVAGPIKPWLPAIARFLLVVTFLEDSLRISTQWSDQIFYLQRHRGFPWLTAEVFLALNVIVMTVGSIMAIAKKHTEVAVGGLALVIVSQSIGYGLIFDSGFFFRNMSVAGGLLMLLADSLAGKRRTIFAGLPSLNETDKATYLQLFGRILLVGLFLSFLLAGEFSALRVIVTAFAFVSCVMVVVGFKAKWSAWVLISVLSISNVVLNNWWNLHHNHPQRDFLKYDFFQTLSIMGGFLLLTNLGPGGLSVDEKKKAF